MELQEAFDTCFAQVKVYCDTFFDMVDRRLIAAEKRATEAEIIARKAIERGSFEYRGTFDPETSYRKGDCITDDGSLWIAIAETRDRPGKGVCWRLAVKRGRDGAPR